MRDVDPDFPLDLVEFLRLASIVNPELSHAATNIIALANSGHRVEIIGSDAATEAATERLNALSERILSRAAGLDGLIRAYIRQILLGGAVSSEDVLHRSLDGVERCVLVPARRIRFRFDKKSGNYLPQQELENGDLVELSPVTYRYFAYQSTEESPYGIPAFAAAIEPILRNRDVWENLKFVVKKFGLLGFVDAALKPPPRSPGELDPAYKQRAQTHLDNTADALADNFKQGMLTHYDDLTIEHNDVTAGAEGWQQVTDFIGQATASGMGVPADMIGMAIRSTETFANVTHTLLVRVANEIRTLVQRRITRTYHLDLWLGSVPAESVAFCFDANPPRDPQSDAMAKETQTRTIFEKLRGGMISPEQAAQEAGYDEYFDEGKAYGDDASRREGEKQTRKILRFDDGARQYRFVRPSLGKIELNRPSDTAVAAAISRFQADYIGQVEPELAASLAAAMEKVRQKLLNSEKILDAEQFGRTMFHEIATVLNFWFEPETRRAKIITQVRRAYDYYRLSDLAAYSIAPDVEFSLDPIDYRAREFAATLDRFYLGKYIENPRTERSIMAFLKAEYLANNDGLFGRGNAENIEKFIKLAVDRIRPLQKFEAERIINTSVQRIRNWANTLQLSQAGVKIARIWNASPETDICKYMVNTVKFLVVGQAAAAVEEMASLTPQDFAARLKPLKPADIESVGIETATRRGYGAPPYHPNCHSRLLATDKEKLSRPDTVAQAYALLNRRWLAHGE